MNNSDVKNGGLVNDKNEPIRSQGTEDKPTTIAVTVAVSVAVTLLSGAASASVREDSLSFNQRVDLLRSQYRQAIDQGAGLRTPLPQVVIESIASAHSPASDDEPFADRGPSWVDWHDFTDSNPGPGERPAWVDAG